MMVSSIMTVLLKVNLYTLPVAKNASLMENGACLMSKRNI